jgi:hypothetical protein
LPEDDERSGRRPPWWFMPIVMTGLGIAAAVLAMTMMTVVA